MILINYLVFGHIFAAATAEITPVLPLTGKSFVLTTNLLIIDSNNTSFKYEIEEAHSEAQFRSRIKYRTIGQMTSWQVKNGIPEEGVFFLHDKMALLIDAADQTCQPSSLRIVDEFLDLNPVNRAQMSKSDFDVIGPSQILFFLDKHRDQFTKSNESDLMVRNTPCVMYDFHYSDKLNYRAEYSVLYGTESLRLSQYQVPLQVIVKSPNYDDRIIIYDFILKDNLLDTPKIDFLESDFDETAKYDQFSIKPAVGCAKFIPSRSDRIFKLGTNRSSFSFRSRIKLPYTNEVNMYSVAYEDDIMSLRVDKFSEDAPSTTITEFYSGRIYHIVKSANSFIFRGQYEGSSKETASCVVAESQSARNQSIPIGLGRMLAGTSEFMYLGRARVRGVEAQAYEAYNSSWPLWFEHPVVYHKTSLNLTSDQLSMRQINSENFVLNTVIFMAVGDQVDQDDQLLQIEIHRMLDSKIIDKITVQVFDFSWQLPARSPSGELVENYFALADLCPALSTENNHYGRVDIVGVANQLNPASGSTEWLNIIPNRNLALLKLFQAFFSLPITMIYDLESRVLGAASSKTLQQSLSLAASFRLAEHERKLAKLTFLGMCESAHDFHDKLLTLFGTFEDCFFLAAHHKMTTFFAYSPRTNKCQIDSDMSGNRGGYSNSSIAFLVFVDATMELYRINHEEDKSLASYDHITSFAHGQDRLDYLNKKNGFSLVDRKYGSINFNIESLEVSESQQKNFYQIDDQMQPDTNKFIGFGLVELDRQNKRVFPELLTANNWALITDLNSLEDKHSDMSFEQCQAACLFDFGCESFSVCVKQAHVECIVSTVSFRDLNLVKQLIEARKDTFKLNQLVSLKTTEAEAIQVKKYPNCEIHNKIYLDYFDQPAKIKQKLTNRLIYPVSGREHCAQLCLNQTLSLLKETSADDISVDILKNPNSDPETINEAVKRHRKSLEDICKAILYLDKSKLLTMSEIIQETILNHVVAQPHDRQTDGYCVVNDELSILDRDRLDKDGTSDSVAINDDILLERYQFKFESLYNKQYGFKLRASAHKNEEDAIFMNLKSQAHVSSKLDYAIVTSFIERGDNNQDYVYADESKCAQICFMQMGGLWPACRSFDLIIVPRSDKTVTICLLNSITLKQTRLMERFDLIENVPSIGNKTGARVWHFEPKSGFVSTNFDRESRLWLAYTGLTGALGSELGPFWVFCIALLAFTSGLMLGIKICPVYLITSRNVETATQDMTTLVERPRVEFSNLVNFEGVVAQRQHET